MKLETLGQHRRTGGRNLWRQFVCSSGIRNAEMEPGDEGFGASREQETKGEANELIKRTQAAGRNPRPSPVLLRQNVTLFFAPRRPEAFFHCFGLHTLPRLEIGRSRWWCLGCPRGIRSSFIQTR